MSAKKKKHGGHEEEHENHERWLITYADMITLLMVLFIVLFAIGQTDLAKYKALKSGLSDGFGKNKLTIVDGGLGLADKAARSATVVTIPDTTSDSRPDALALSDAQAVEQAQAVEKRSMEATQAAIEASLAGTGMENAVQFRTEERGLVVSVLSDRVLFKAGFAELTEEGRAVLGTVAEAILPLSNAISVEGHTDNVPIAGRFASNWELSTARATSVLRDLIERHAFPPARLSASGYADQKPIESNATAKGRSANRRVEIVILTGVQKSPAAPPASAVPTTLLTTTTVTSPTAATTTTVDIHTELSTTASTISFSEPLPASATTPTTTPASIH